TNRFPGWSVPAEPGDTLGGLVFNTLGRAPRKGDQVRVPGYKLVVNDVSGARITRLSLYERAETNGEGDASASPGA
ncbi:MAG: transporter associated domain-containing protein, partial [Myxococcota bacterium]